MLEILSGLQTLNMITSDRKHDLEYLRSIINKVPPEKRREIREIAHRISNEPPHVRDMRQRLIKEFRAGNSENVKDINKWVEKHERYQNK